MSKGKRAVKSPAFQFYAAEYLADENVALMTLEEEGAYIRALAFCWREGSIPADPELLSRLLKNASSNVVGTVVRRFEKLETPIGTRLIHSRLELERKKQKDWMRKSHEAGVKSGKARRAKKLHTEPTLTNGSPKNEPTYEPNANSSFASSSSNKYSLATLVEIYEAYPKHIAKDAALPAIEKALRKSKLDPSEMLAKVAAYATQRKGDPKHPEFTPNPATWFNQGRYADETLQPKPKLIWEAVNESRSAN